MQYFVFAFKRNAFAISAFSSMSLHVGIDKYAILVKEVILRKKDIAWKKIKNKLTKKHQH